VRRYVGRHTYRQVIPDAPFTSRLGTLPVETVGSCKESSNSAENHQWCLLIDVGQYFFSDLFKPCFILPAGRRLLIPVIVLAFHLSLHRKLHSWAIRTMVYHTHRCIAALSGIYLTLAHNIHFFYMFVVCQTTEHAIARAQNRFQSVVDVG